MSHRGFGAALLGLFVVGGVWLNPGEAFACSTFHVGSATGSVIGKSYDWDNGLGVVVINPRGLRKHSLVLGTGDVPMTWVAKYGSVTFNQYGVEMPNGGMNEAGLVIEILWLEASQYPRPDARPSLNELQWIQHHLDRYDSVDAMKRGADKLRIAPMYGRVHYMACDRGGHCAIFEYLEGQAIVSSGDDLPLKVLTNHPYRDAVSWHRARRRAPVRTSVANADSSMARFHRLALTAPRARPEVAPAFELLDKVRMGDYTKWQLVYEPHEGQVHFRTGQERRTKTLTLGMLDFSCRVERSALAIDADPGIAAHQQVAPFERSANKALIRNSLMQLPDEIPSGLVERLAGYPSTLRCASNGAR